MMRWQDILDLTEPDDSPILQPKVPGIRCACGRFAKWVGDEHYYNGQFDCYRYVVRCTRCGDVTVECV